MKATYLRKTALVLGLVSSIFIFNNVACAYERYTWSDLVTGGSGKASDEDKLSVITEWVGLKRIVRSQVTDGSKMSKARAVINNRQKHSNDAYFKAVMDLRYTYLYRFKDRKKADETLAYLDSIPELKIKAEAERVFSDFKSHKILDDKFCERLYNLRNRGAYLFPYDNGYMPIIKLERLSFILALKEMLEGKGSRSEHLAYEAWKGIPSDILYYIATDRRDAAYKIYLSAKDNMEPAVRKLTEDFLYPLYMPVKLADRKFLAGILCVEQFSGFGIDLINESLTGYERVSKVEHALAALSDVYVRHNAYGEAQKVLKLLKDYYPSSLWLK